MPEIDTLEKWTELSELGIPLRSNDVRNGDVLINWNFADSQFVIGIADGANLVIPTDEDDHKILGSLGDVIYLGHISEWRDATVEEVFDVFEDSLGNRVEEVYYEEDLVDGDFILTGIEPPAISIAPGEDYTFPLMRIRFLPVTD